MPADFEIDPEKRRATIRLTGDTTGDTMADALVALEADERWQPGFDRLWDSRDVRSVALLLEDLTRFGKLILRERLRARKTAIVVAQNEYAVARLYERQNRALPIRVFLSMDEAEAWLAEA